MLRRKLRPLENLVVGHYRDYKTSTSSNFSTNNNRIVPVIPILSSLPPTATIISESEVEINESPLQCDYSIAFPGAISTTPPRHDSSLHSEVDNDTTTTTTDHICDDEIAYAAIFLDYGRKKADDRS
eukprot:gene28265-37189_t